MKNINWVKISIILILVTVSFAGCATVPKEAGQLSAELGKQISSIEDSHISLLNKYFKGKKNEIDNFIKDEWAPLLTKKFFENSEISDAWNTVVTNNDKTEREEFLAMAGNAIQKQVTRKRLELLKPLEDLEDALEREIRLAYNRAYSMNNTITSFLFSTSELTENQNRYLEMIGVTDKKISKVIDESDNIVSKILSIKDIAESELNTLKSYKEHIQSLIDQL